VKNILFTTSQRLVEFFSLNVELAQALGFKWISNDAPENYLHSLLKKKENKTFRIA